MAKSKTSKSRRKLTGSVVWCSDDESVSRGEVRHAILRSSSKELVVEADYEGDLYLLKLLKDKGSFCEGTWSYDDGSSGPVQGRLYCDPNGYAFIGRWLQDGDWYICLLEFS